MHIYLAVVSAIAKALKNLRHGGIKTIGYNGLTLPVMVDLVSGRWVGRRVGR